MTSDKESHTTQEEASLKVHRSRSVRRAEVTTDGRKVSHAGTALLSELAIAPLLAQQPVAWARPFWTCSSSWAPGAAVGGWELEQERPQRRPLSGYSSAGLDNPRQVAAEDHAAPQG